MVEIDPDSGRVRLDLSFPWELVSGAAVLPLGAGECQELGGRDSTTRFHHLAECLTVSETETPLDPRQLLEYWRRCLADADLHSPDLRRFRPLPVGWDALDAGKVSGEVLEQALDQIGEEAVPEKAPTSHFDVQIALLGLRAEVSHGKARQLNGGAFAPFWIPARLDCETGGLKPSPNARPWMVRRHLEPQVASVPTVGAIEAMDAFLAAHPCPTGDEWPDLMRYSERFFEAVAESSPRSFDLAGWIRLEPAMLVRSAVRGAGDALLTLYDRLADESSLPPLIVSLAEKGRREPVDPKPFDEPTAPRHLGHMTRRFHLGPTQCESLHAALRLDPGELVAINGPPGTGKTTLVQSLVACLWVERALDGAEPPVIVACSTNNRAVTNVLDSLAPADADNSGILGRRWLDDELSSHGLFFPARSKRDSAGHHLWASPGFPWQGLPERMENDDYRQAAAEHYLSSACEYFDQTPVHSVEKVVDRLHRELQAEVRQLGANLRSA